MELAQSATSFVEDRHEQALVVAARCGDDRAFEQLYAQYRDRVRAFILSKVRDHGRAEDISQDVFMAALRQLRGSEQTIAFKPWIFTIAKNACIDESRRSSRGREVSVENDDDFSTGPQRMLSLAPTPPAVVEGKQRLDDLRGAFGGLSESHHRLLVMREFEGRSYDEIGDRLGMSRQMVESGLFRARRKLGEEYEELASGRRCEQVQAVVDSGAARTLRAMGIKQRRRVGRHLSHCEACRHHARLAGVDATLLKPRSIGAKIAALLPFGGLWRWPWRGGRGSAARGAQASSGHVAGSAGAGGAAQAAGTAGSSVTLGQAAAAVAALAIAGAGGGLVIAQHEGSAHHATPALTRHLPAGADRARSSGSARSAPAAKPAITGGSAAGRGHTGGAIAGRAHVAGGRAGSSTSHSGSRLTNRRDSPRRPTSGQPGRAPTSTATTPSASGARTPTTSPVSNTRIGSRAAKTVSGTGQAVNKTGQVVNKITDPVKKVVGTVLSAPPVKKIVSTVGSLLPPVKKVVGTVLSAPPVQKVVSTVGSLLPPPVKKVVTTVGSLLPPASPPSTTSPGSGSGSSGSGAGSGSSGSSSGLGGLVQNPVGTVNKIVGGL